MKNKKITVTFVSIILALVLAVGTLAGVLLHQQHANPVVFRGRIEQITPENPDEPHLVFTANGEEFTGNADLTAGGEVIFPLMSGEVTSNGDGWYDENGKAAIAAPTITISSSDGSELDVGGLYCQVQIHGVDYNTEFRSIVNAMRFGIGVEYCNNSNGTSCLIEWVTNTTAHVDEPWSSSTWFSIGELSSDQVITVDLAAFAVSEAGDCPFTVEIVFATGEYLEGKGIDISTAVEVTSLESMPAILYNGKN